MSKAKAIGREAVKRETRASRRLGAGATIGELRPGMELFVLTFGQFSFVDALVYLLQETGPADMVLSTWTAAAADLSEAHQLVEDRKIKEFRLLIDHNMLRRPNAEKLVRHIRERFGDEGFRTTQCHAKFAAIRNETWHLAVRTSMNLNTNPRLENLEISDDPDLCGFLFSVVDDVFRATPGAEKRRAIPELKSLPFVEPPKIAMGAATLAPPPKVDGR